MLLLQGGHVPWLLHAVQQVAGHPGVYITAEAVEAVLGPHHAARLEALTTAALTRCVDAARMRQSRTRCHRL